MIFPLPILYALAVLVVLLVLYHPFVTKLDRVRYIVFCMSAFALPVYLTRSSLDPKNPYEKSAYLSLSCWTPHYCFQSSFKSYSLLAHSSSSSMSFSQVDLLTDSCLLAIITASVVTFTGLLSRWEFPILYIRPGQSHSFHSIVRHIVPLMILGLTKSSYPVLALTAPMMSVLWYLSGNYFLRRWRLVLAATLVPATCGMMCVWSSDQTYLFSFIGHWSMVDWCALTATVTLATSSLDHWDAILNMYPHLVHADVKIHSRIQSPMHLRYWLALAQLIGRLPSEDELPCLPIQDLQAAIRLLGPSSRTWKIMASLFPVNLRQDLCLIYAFFRVADDLVDDAPTFQQREQNLGMIRNFLTDVFYGPEKHGNKQSTEASSLVKQDPSIRSDIDWDAYGRQLPSSDVLAVFRSFSRTARYLCPRAAFELTDAWEMDLKGNPIADQDGLSRYAELISGAFGELCTCVIMYKTGHGNWNGADTQVRDDGVLSRARATGQCLQLIIIARDIIADSLDGRCYVPLQYMPSHQMYHDLKEARDPARVSESVLKSFALRILNLADRLTVQAQQGIDGLPSEIQDGVRAAFEVYSAISPALRREPGYPLRVKVPKYQQYFIALTCIYGVHSITRRTLARIHRLVASQPHILKRSHTIR